MSAARRGPLRRFFHDSPVLSNSLIYTCYAVAAVFVVQTAEQWREQPINRRKRKEIEFKEGATGERAAAVKSESDSSWNLQFRTGDKIVRETEPYYNLQFRYKDDYLFNFDLARLIGMMFFSCCYNGPANALIYPYYFKIFGQTSAGVNRCLLFDQIFYMPCCAIPACWYFNGVVKKYWMRDPRLDFKDDTTVGTEFSKSNVLNESDSDASKHSNSRYTLTDSLTETTREMKEKWFSNVLCTMAIWIPAESINMRFTPVYLRSVVAGTTSFFWTTGMAVWTHVV